MGIGRNIRGKQSPQRMLVALIAVALTLTGICATVVILLIFQSRNDAQIVDVMGRQRMLSELMGKALLNSLVVRHLEHNVDSISELLRQDGYSGAEFTVVPGENESVRVLSSTGIQIPVQPVTQSFIVATLVADWGRFSRLKVSHLDRPTASDEVDAIAWSHLQLHSDDVYYRTLLEGETGYAFRFYVVLQKEGQLFSIRRIEITYADQNHSNIIRERIDLNYRHVSEVFAKSLAALKTGGEYPVNLEMSRWGRIEAIRAPRMQNQIGQIEAGLSSFQSLSQQLSKQPPPITGVWRQQEVVAQATERLKNLSNDLVSMYIADSEQRRATLFIAVVLLTTSASLAYLMIYMVINKSVFMPLRRIFGEVDSFAMYEEAERARLLTQQRLRESESRFRRLSEVTAEGVMISDDKKVLDCNSAVSEMTGYFPEELIGGDSLKIFDPTSVELIHSGMTQKHEGRYDAMVRRRDGVTFPVEVITRLIPFENRMAHVVVVRDITERKRQEEQRLAAAEAHRVALVREVHHRIKNTLQGATGLLRQQAQANPVAREALEAAISQVSSIAVVMGLESIGGEQDLRLCRLVTALATANRDLMRSTVTLQLPDETPCPIRILSDEAVPIALALNELIMNAIKHGSDSLFQVHVSQEESKGRALVTIRNHGVLPPGIDFAAGKALGTGLDLIKSLLPSEGVVVKLWQEGEDVVAQMELRRPLVDFR